MSDAGAYYMISLQILLIVVSVGFFLSGLDDLFVDVCHILRSIYRARYILPKYPKFKVEQMLETAEKRAAILIPAWMESAVIGRMLRNTLQTLNYSNYHIFVGTYPNDEDTQREVEKVRHDCQNVHRIVCPKDGPTNKADCLNWIWQGIQLFERNEGFVFEFFVMHDSEDIVHPLSLKLFNHLIPRRDMVQLPVFPLEVPWNKWVGGHYMDEFAEFHSKNLSIRELFSRTVPSAGTGCAFSRKVLEVISGNANNLIFNSRSLTEDYEFGLKLRQFGLKGIFVNKAFHFEVHRQTRTGRKTVLVKEHIATRENFPYQLWAAVKQKARWGVGITMQGWAELGWGGGAGSKYMFVQDRKTILTNQINVLGYLVLLGVSALWVRARIWPEAYRYPELVVEGSRLYYLILADTLFLVWRLLVRGYYVWGLYGFKQSLLSIPRQVVGNVINWLAGCRAAYLGLRHLFTGKSIGWDKTAHVFPDQEQLKVFHRRLGDLLLEKRLVSVAVLDLALQMKKESGKLLGSILIEMGVITEDQLRQVLAQQSRRYVREKQAINRDQPPEILNEQACS